jgi:hypothetical protein
MTHCGILLCNAIILSGCITVGIAVWLISANSGTLFHTSLVPTFRPG